MAGYDVLILLAIVVLLLIAAAVAIPRVMRSWSVATSPTDERVEYVSHIGSPVDQGAASVDGAECEHTPGRQEADTPIRQP